MWAYPHRSVLEYVKRCINTYFLYTPHFKSSNDVWSDLTFSASTNIELIS